MAYIKLPPQDYLLQCLNYDPDTGKVVRLERPRHHFDSEHLWRRWNAQWSGRRIGSQARIISLDGHNYILPRVIWKLVTGDEPEFEIDHRDVNHSNNAWSNLRLATHGQNQHNRNMLRNNSSGFKGVSKKRNKFVARVSINKTAIYIGLFDSAEEAYERYREAATLHHQKFFNPGGDGDANN